MTESEKYDGITQALSLVQKLSVDQPCALEAQSLVEWAKTDQHLFVLFQFAVMCYGLNGSAIRKATMEIALLLAQTEALEALESKAIH